MRMKRPAVGGCGAVCWGGGGGGGRGGWGGGGGGGEGAIVWCIS